MLRVPITEASAKVRTGGPVDDDADMTLGVWAGVLPCALTFGAAIAAPDVTAATPEYVRAYSR